MLGEWYECHFGDSLWEPLEDLGENYVLERRKDFFLKKFYIAWYFNLVLPYFVPDSEKVAAANDIVMVTKSVVTRQYTVTKPTYNLGHFSSYNLKKDMENQAWVFMEHEWKRMQIEYSNYIDAYSLASFIWEVKLVYKLSDEAGRFQ